MTIVRTEHSSFKYLPVAASERAWGLRVTGSGTAHVPPHAQYPPSVHPDDHTFEWEKDRVLSEFQAVYITEGCGTFESKRTGQVHLEGGSMMLLFPGEWHRYMPDYMPDEEVGWTEYWIAFDSPQSRSMLDREVLSVEEPVLDLGYQEIIIRLYREVLDLMDSGKLGFREIMASLTYQILARATAIVKQRQFGSKRVAAVIQHAQVYSSKTCRNVSTSKISQSTSASAIRGSGNTFGTTRICRQDSISSNSGSTRRSGCSRRLPSRCSKSPIPAVFSRSITSHASSRRR